MGATAVRVLLLVLYIVGTLRAAYAQEMGGEFAPVL